MTTYNYRLLSQPKESELQTLGADGWQVIATGSDPRDGVLAWALMQRADEKTPTAQRVAAQEKRH